MIGDRDIFVTEIINRKIGIEPTCNKERKSCFDYFGYNIIAGIFAVV